MRDLWTNGILPRILILLVLITLLGFSPTSHVVERSLRVAAQTQEFGSFETTAQNLAQIAEHLPWRSDLWEQAGLLALAGKAPAAAITYFKESAAGGFLSLQGYLGWGEAYLQTGNYYTALQIWEAAQLIFGPSEEALTRSAEIHRELEDYPALIADLKALINLPAQISDPNLNFELGLLLAAHDPATAPPYLLQAAELNPESAAARELSFAIQRALPTNNPTYTLMAAGQKLADLNEWDLAARAFRQATELQPEYAEAWAFFGEARQHLKPVSFTAARIALEKALEIDPNSLPANLFMALYWQRLGDYDQAVRYLAIAAEIDPNNPDLQVDLGAATALRGDLETAAGHYQAALDISYQAPVYWRKLIEFHIRYNLDLQETALPLGRAALISHPDHPEVLDAMGQLLLRLGDLNTARRFLQRAASSDPDFAPAQLHLGVLYSLLGEAELASEYLWQAISLAPNSAIASQAGRVLEENSAP